LDLASQPYPQACKRQTYKQQDSSCGGQQPLGYVGNQHFQRMPETVGPPQTEVGADGADQNWE
jgi:hypothetical protein